ncbi:MAG TPA: chloride channel protein [Candidatus Solibacter sp.]
MAKPDRAAHEDKVLLILTLIIGAVVGLVVVAFILVTERLGSRLYPAGGAAWRRLVIPLVGSFATGLLMFRYFPDARGSGIPQTKVALFLRDGYISLRTVLGKFGLCSVSLATGIALGREGPSVQVSAGIASVLGRKLGLGPSSVRALIPIGASAALAAAFNTPIAAVLFSLEEVMGDMHAPVLGSIVLSSATSWIVLHLLLGDEPLFHVPSYQLVHPLEFGIYALLGVVGGLVSVGFVKLLLWQRMRFSSLPARTRWLQPAVGGLTVGILGWYFPAVLGVGYGYVGQALNGQMLIGAMALLVCLKIVATSTCYASGNAGGIFGPSLFIGAMMGGAVGGVAHTLLPDYTGSAGAYALVGMGAAFAGIIRVPLTSVIMIFEITRDYTIIVPLMISNLASYWISSRLQEEPIYEALQHQDGIHLPSGAKAREDLLMVGNAFRPESQALSATQSIEQALATVERERGAWPVIDGTGLLGMVKLEQLEAARAAGTPTLAGDLVHEKAAHLHSDDSLDYAMRRIASSGIKVLPVVSRENERELKGTVSVTDILEAYGIGRARPVEAAPAEELPQKRLFAVATAVLVVLGIIAGLVNYGLGAERTARAERDYQAGNQLLARDRTDEAIEQYRHALSIEHRFEYRLALGKALTKMERPGEALIYLEEARNERPTNALVNLAVAEAEMQAGQVERAVMHYQRAIYGTWPADAEGERVRARLELIDALIKEGKLQQAKAELISLASDMGEDAAVQRVVAQRLSALGMHDQAAEVYRRVAKRNPEVLGQLGEEELAAGNIAAACVAFHAGGNPAREALCAQMLAMDPSVPGLRAAERSRRSQALLVAVEEELQACGGTAPARRPAARNTAEDNVALAVELWAKRLEVCAAAPVANAALTRVMDTMKHGAHTE